MILKGTIYFYCNTLFPGGVFLGGLVVRRFKLKETLLMAAKCCLIIKVATIFTSLIWLIPGCDEVQLAGIVKPYWDR